MVKDGNNKVSIIYDLTANNHDATNATTDCTNPTYVPNIRNGQGGLRFNKSAGGCLEVPTKPLTTIGGGSHTMYLVFSTTVGWQAPAACYFGTCKANAGTGVGFGTYTTIEI